MGGAGTGDVGTGGTAVSGTAVIGEGSAAVAAAGGVGVAGARAGGFFGVNAHYSNSVIGDKLDEAQIKFVRVDLSWAWFRTIERNCQRAVVGMPGCDHVHLVNSLYFDIPDGWRARGITIFATLAYRYDDDSNPIPPGPEFSHCTESNSCVPMTDDPTNAAWQTFLEEWDDYVTAMVRDVGRMVTYFGIWNEPNATRPDDTKASFAGHDWQYDELVSRACTILHAHGNQCVAPSTSIYTDTEQNFQRDLSWHKARLQANLGLIDVADGHIYDYHAIFAAKAAKAAEVAAESDSVAEILFWVTETAPFVWDPVLDRPGYHLELQERELVQQLTDVQTGVSGIDGLFYYDLQSVEFGLTEALSATEFSPRPAFNALVQLRNGTYQVPPTTQCTDIRGSSCTAACLASGYECP